MKPIAGIILAADIAVVVYVEKVLMAVNPHTHAHTPVKELVIVGLIFALPALVILLVAALRGRTPSAPAAPRRPGYSSFGTRP